MAVGGDDDTLAGSLPTFSGTVTPVTESELVAGRYRIMRWLGGGGMGRVYEALDTELSERVAMKVLKANLSDDAVARFRREVKLTRRIQHRNVARMFDIGEHKGERFLTMELIDGDPLTRKMSGAPMPWPQLLALAQQLTAGLAAAHEAGVVHRDLKPDNVLIEDATGRAVLTDFGIARSGDDPSVTQIGAIVGTPRYMAPEQLAGEEVDTRADLFSLGVMLFELATGTRPWAGDHAIAIAVAQATSAPRSMDSVATVPPHFVAMVSACLQLDPANRPASAAEIGAALAEDRPVQIAAAKLATAAAIPVVAPATRPRTPTSGGPRAPAIAPAPAPTSLAVAPITCAPADEYLADGLLEDLIDTLSTTEGIRVRPAGIMRQASAPDARELGQRLQVDHVVTASLRRTSTGLRIATRLLSVADGFQIWANRQDCVEAEILDVSDELAKGIADALSTRYAGDTRPTDQRAVDLYLRARAELRRFWGSHAENAAALLEQAVTFAPTSAPILAASAWANVQTWVMRGEASYFPKAAEALERGLATGHGEASLASAQFELNRGNVEHAAQDLARALVRAPMSAQTHELAGKLLLEIEGTVTARAYFETARGLDPGRANIIDNELVRLDALEGKWADAEARNARMLADTDPSIQQLGMVTRARLDCWQGRVDVLMGRAKDIVARVSPAAGSIFKLITMIEDFSAVTPEIWDKLVETNITPDRPQRQYLIRLQVFAEISLAMGDRERSLQCLERVAELGLLDQTWLRHCPLFAPLGEDRRYIQVLRTVSDRATRVLTAFHGSTSS